MVVQHRNDINQGGAIGPRLLNVFGKEFKLYGRRGGGCRMVGCRVPVSWGDVGKVSPSEGGVGPSGPAFGKVDRCPTKPGPGGPGLGWDREPSGEFGKGNGDPVGGSWRIMCEESLFQPRLGKLLGRGNSGAFALW